MTGLARLGVTLAAAAPAGAMRTGVARRGLARVALGVAALGVAGFVSVAARADDDLVKKGEYLTRAADCAACHASPSGQSWVGGRKFVLPMGVLYSPNITPDKETGIGQYSDDEWVEMMHEGVGRGGKHLYPAMPYNSYTQMSRDDALAIKAYLFAQTPVHVTAPQNDMKFPFNQRWLMVGWNLLNNPDARLKPVADKSAEWNRGAYLVEALGHCAQCHTPRNFMQGLSDKHFAGAVQQGWTAYNMTSDKDHGLGGWSDEQLVQYLGTGHADGRGPASGPMAEAVQNSLRYMTPEDLKAMVAYLRDVPARAEGPPALSAAVEAPAANVASASVGSGGVAGAGVAVGGPGGTVVAVDAAGGPADPNGVGARVFAQACSGCHLQDGAGRQSPWAALGGDHSTGDPAGVNIVAVLVHGSQIETKDGLMFMHGFTESYTRDEMAAVSNYVIAHYSGRVGTVSAKDFKIVQ